MSSSSSLFFVFDDFKTSTWNWICQCLRRNRKKTHNNNNQIWNQSESDNTSISNGNGLYTTAARRTTKLCQFDCVTVCFFFSLSLFRDTFSLALVVNVMGFEIYFVAFFSIWSYRNECKLNTCSLTLARTNIAWDHFAWSACIAFAWSVHCFSYLFLPLALNLLPLIHRFHKNTRKKNAPKSFCLSANQNFNLKILC